MDTAGDQPVVVGVFRDTPADRAGLRPGDVIVAVNGVATKGTPLDVVVSKVRGPAGTPVTLTVTRTGSTEPLTFTITRATVDIPTVEYAMVPGTAIGDIRVEQFSANAGDAFRTDLRKLLAERPSSLILDLRGNPGGYVTDAVTVASQFLTSGNVYLQRDASMKETATPVEKDGLAPTIPLVVLVDGGTASASEIVTGALQDPKRATIVGVRTFGTGTVLATYDLPDGSALRIGTVEWLTPDGHQIWHHGLVPDVIVGTAPGVRVVVPDDLRTMTQTQLTTSPDVQIRKAIELLLGHPL
jgi:carboxyl-terminal processing protease